MPGMRFGTELGEFTSGYSGTRVLGYYLAVAGYYCTRAGGRTRLENPGATVQFTIFDAEYTVYGTRVLQYPGTPVLSILCGRFWSVFFLEDRLST